MFFNGWQLWQQLSFVLLTSAAVVLCYGYSKRRHRDYCANRIRRGSRRQHIEYYNTMIIRPFGLQALRHGPPVTEISDILRIGLQQHQPQSEPPSPVADKMASHSNEAKANKHASYPRTLPAKPFLARPDEPNARRSTGDAAMTGSLPKVPPAALLPHAIEHPSRKLNGADSMGAASSRDGEHQLLCHTIDQVLTKRSSSAQAPSVASKDNEDDAWGKQPFRTEALSSAKKLRKTLLEHNDVAQK